MATELELQLGRLKPGDHLCLIYENAAEQLATVVPYIQAGLARGERCLCIADDLSIAAVAQALAAAGTDVARERRRGALRMLTKQDSYLKSGKFDPQMMIGFLRSARHGVLADGFSGLRVTGEMSWALGPESGCDRLIEYEALLNTLAKDSPSMFLCLYDSTRFDPVVIHDVLRTHPIAIVGDLVCPNPYYEPPELVLSLKQQPDVEFKRERVTWWIAQLRRARAAEQDRERAVEQLQRSVAEQRAARKRCGKVSASWLRAQRVAHLGYWEYDIDADRVTWSDEVCRIAGVPLRSVLTMAEVRKMIHPEDRSLHAEAWAKALRGSGTYDAEYRVVSPRWRGEVCAQHRRGDSRRIGTARARIWRRAGRHASQVHARTAQAKRTKIRRGPAGGAHRQLGT